MKRPWFQRIVAPQFPNRNRPIVRPVSQVVFPLDGEHAFDSAVGESVAWISRRLGTKLNESAFSGEPFDTTQLVGMLPATAERIDGEEAKVWAAKLDYADKEVPQRQWTTEIFVGQKRQITRFGTRLTQVTLGEDAPFTPTIPGIVKQLASRNLGSLDGLPLTDQPRHTYDDETYGYFESLLLDPKRQFPIVVVSEDTSGHSLYQSREIAQRLCGSCHVVRITDEISWKLTREFGREFSVFGGAARIYRQSFDPYDGNPFEHDLVLPKSFASRADMVVDVVRRALSLSLTSIASSDQAIRFEEVRRAAAEVRQQQEFNTSGATEADTIKILTGELEKLKIEISEERSAAQQLIEEAAERQFRAESSAQQYRSEYYNIKSRLASVEQRIQEGGFRTDSPLNSFDDIDDWCRTHLAGSIIVLPNAIRESRKSIFHDPRFFGDALLALRDFYVAMRRGLRERRDFEDRLNELGIEDSACFSNPGDINQFPAYKKSYNGKSILLTRHLKFRGGYDATRMFRIYYYWDGGDDMLVIGHMPTHLDNMITN